MGGGGGRSFEIVLNIGSGGLQNRKGGVHVKFNPYRTLGGGERSCCHGEGVGQKSFEIVLMWELEVLAILKGGRKKLTPFKKGVTKGFTLS